MIFGIVTDIVAIDRFQSFILYSVALRYEITAIQVKKSEWSPDSVRQEYQLR